MKSGPKLSRMNSTLSPEQLDALRNNSNLAYSLPDYALTDSLTH